MITERNGLKELTIFWDFSIDTNLPKYKNKNNIHQSNTIRFIDPISFDNSNRLMVGEVDIMKQLQRKSFLDRLKFFFNIKTVKKTKQIKTILEFFTNLSDNFKHLTPIGEIADTYEKAIIQANEMGQVALEEKLKKILDVSRSEAHLIQIGLNEYVTQEQMIDFYEQTKRDKNLKLTWIKNFAKVIPDEILKIKKTLDKKELFDNYVILHYDPNDDATNITKKEKEVRKDPILFGLIKDSSKLYYIGDWKDEYCDLTLEKMFSELGEKTLSINNRSLKTYIKQAGDYEQKRKKV